MIRIIILYKTLNLAYYVHYVLLLTISLIPYGYCIIHVSKSHRVVFYYYKFKSRLNLSKKSVTRDPQSLVGQCV